MTKPQTKCQELSAEIAASTAPFFRWLSHRLHHHRQPLALNLTSQQIPVFLAQIGEIEPACVFLSPRGIRHATLVHETVAGWQSLLNAKTAWHQITGPLTEQEQESLITSSLSQTFHRLLSTPPTGHFLIPAALHSLRLPDPAAYRAAALTLTAGEQRTPRQLAQQLADAGYQRHTTPPAAGSFRIRGEQLDIRPAIGPLVTITLFHHAIEAITVGRKRPSRHRSYRLPPAAFPAAAVPLSRALTNCTVIQPHHLPPLGQHTIIYNAIHSQRRFPLQPDAAPAHARPQRRRIFIMYENRDRIEHLAASQPSDTALCPQPLARRPLTLRTPRALITTEAQLLPAPPADTPRPHAQSLPLIAQLRAGHPAVHSDHGIGIFEGLLTRTLDGQTREYLVLRYAAGDTLSVPVEYAHKVTPYIGERHPSIHRLHSPIWRKAKQRAAADAARFARELIATASHRSASRRPPYLISPNVEQELHATFPHRLTAHQTAAWDDIVSDLTSPAPMDRLVVGDVGFGKTELAIRAAKHAASNQRQVAILAPTTVLARQHDATFRRRLAGSLRIAALSRFTPPRQRTALLRDIAAGRCDIVIGTHALLAPDLTWHRLGLVIIDEEQRFGVRHKERLKRCRAAADVLSLSATPIPRTLSMALAGLKSLSVITTPPAGRQAVRTHVARETDELLRRAVKHELARHGQVLVVAPHVRELPGIARRVQNLVRDARPAIAHGQLPDRQLAAVMEQLDRGQANVLVASSIIENGLDNPRANTLIVLRAPYFGLADLYQLRGRVGRRSQRAEAFFLYRQEQLTDLQQRRLAALTETARLGSGWHLAQRDLELRGAGNLLGAEQSGHAAAVGVQLYLDLVRRAADASLRGEAAEVTVELPLPAGIPPHYLADSAVRLDYYQQLARARTTAALSRTLQYIEQSFGPAPVELRNLALLLRLQQAAALSRITAVTARRITPPRQSAYYQLNLATDRAPQILPTLASLGPWQATNQTLQLTCHAVTTALITSVTHALERAAQPRRLGASVVH